MKCGALVTFCIGSTISAFFLGPTGRADIYQWEYVNPADPSQGKQQSTTLAPDGAGVDAVPNADLTSRNLTMAYLVGKDLTGAYFTGATLSNADLSQTNLTGAYLYAATLTDTNFTGAEVRGAGFSRSVYCCDPCGPCQTGTGITFAQLSSTASYQAHDLAGIGLGDHNLGGWNFAEQNLANASFGNAWLAGANLSRANLANASFYIARLPDANLSQANLTNVYFVSAELTGADFTGALVRGADFSRNFLSPFGGPGLTPAQLYSTASYQARDLTGIGFEFRDLSGWNFAGQNLANASFGQATLSSANFTAADARGASLWIPGSAITLNLIRPGGHVSGLALNAGDLLNVRDYDGRPEYGTTYPPISITVDEHLSMAPGGTLRMVFEADTWDSTISFAPGIPVNLGGTLELTFADDVNLAVQRGRTFDIFDWTGVVLSGAFVVSSPYQWDLSNLYTGGKITLIAVPEPATVVMFLCAASCLMRRPSVSWSALSKCH